VVHGFLGVVTPWFTGSVHAIRHG